TTSIIRSHCHETTTLKRGDIVSISLLCIVLIAQSSSGACSRTHCAYLLLREKKKIYHEREDARWKACVRARPASREHGDTFVVQKHSATRLHYDFRLAVDVTLKSWAVPKGPSLNPEDKRLAVQTEDHPLDYAGFEGKIPEGNYGAGTVMVWDRGTFSPIGDADALTQIERGEIKFHLNGEKLRGSFVLVKLKHGEKKNEWLMIKHKDADMDPSWDIDGHDGAALTGRTIEEIADEVPPHREASP